MRQSTNALAKLIGIASIALVFSACGTNAPGEPGACSTNGDCPAGSVCQDRQCLALCARDMDCEADEACINSVCRTIADPDCTSASQCGAAPACMRDDGVQCVGGRCIFLPATNGIQCDDGNLCTENDVCDGQSGCAGEAVTCPSLVDCTVEQECEADEDCISGKCLGQNGADCGVNAECQNICLNNVCAVRSDLGGDCDGTADCLGSLVCENDTCIKPDGEFCGSATECRSGFCIDGVCCDNECIGDCNRCDIIAGVCGPALDGAECGECDVCLSGNCSPLTAPEGPECEGNCTKCVAGDCADYNNGESGECTGGQMCCGGPLTCQGSSASCPGSTGSLRTNPVFRYAKSLRSPGKSLYIY